MATYNKPNRKYKIIDHERVMLRHRQGYSVREMSDMEGWHMSSVYKVLKRKGVKPNPPTRRTRKQRYQELAHNRPLKNADADMAGIRSLAMAIITKAAEDYRVAIRWPYRIASQYSRAEIERFFKGEWYEELTSAANNPIAGERILNTIWEQEEQRKIKRYEKNRARANREAEILASAAAGLQDDKGSDS